jgi:3-hydroxyisobutyrate dehydrogenase
LVERGGAGAASAAGAAREADVLMLVVVNAAQVEEVLFGAGEVAQALPRDGVVVVCSTVPPEAARATAERLQAMGLEMLDAPVSGGTSRAADGTLSVMASGSATAFARAQPVLAAIGAHVYNLGPACGMGSTMKVVNQLLCGVHLAVACEAVAFGAKAGIDPRLLYEIICGSAAVSHMFQTRVPHVLADDYSPHSAVDIFVKDLDIVLQAGKAHGFPLATAAAAHQLLVMASGAGYGTLDDAAVVKVFEDLLHYRIVED